MDTIERYNNKYGPKRMKSEFIFMNMLEALRPYIIPIYWSFC